MIYWSEVRRNLIPHCPLEAGDWTLDEIIRYLNKERKMSMKTIADLTKGQCGRTTLCLKIKKDHSS